MIDLDLKNQEVLMQLSVTKPVSAKEMISNFVGNLLTPAGGDIADKVNLILTQDVLYLQYVGHTSIGYAEETRRIDSIQVSDINSVNVLNYKEIESVELRTVSQVFVFTRNNSKNDNLGRVFVSMLREIHH